MRISKKAYKDACLAMNKSLRELKDGSYIVDEGYAAIAYAERDKDEAINKLRRYARKMLKYGHHQLECEWNNVNIGSMKDEKTSCTCGWVEFREDLRRLVR